MRVAITWGPFSDQWTQEVAVNTFHLRHHHSIGNTFSWPDAVQYAADKIADKLASHWTALAPYHSPKFGIKQVKTSQLDDRGHAVVEGVHTPGATLYGTGTHQAVLPPEVAVAVSLYGYVPGNFVADKGRKRGRFYLPYISPDVLDTNGTVSTAAMPDWLVGWQGLLNDIQGMHTDDATGSDPDYWDLVVVSTMPPAGASTKVQRVGMDTLFDSQRRRQNRPQNAVRLLQPIN